MGAGRRSAMPRSSNGASWPRPSGSRTEPVTARRPGPVPDPSAALSRMQLEMAAAVYAKAWGDAEATRTRGHAPLPHQTVALERAGAAPERLRPEGARDLDRALERDPE